MPQQHKIYAVIMAGGKGTRFWPESTARRPKQYLSVTGNSSLLQQTLHRLDGLVEAKHRAIVTVAEQEALAKEHGRGVTWAHGPILEPQGRNTGPCILLSLARLEAQGACREDIVIILPSDHLIHARDKFQDSLKRAIKLAKSEEGLVTIGIRPTLPHTGFGYIHQGTTHQDGFAIRAFREKPALALAKEYLASGEYFWNAGMFVGRLGTFLDEFKRHAKEMSMHYEELKSTLDRPAELANVYARLPAISFDYAVMEKSEKSYVVEATFDWSDLGSWDALEGQVKNEQGNWVTDNRASFFKDATGNIVHAPNKLVAMIGVSDLVVAVHGDALLIVPKSRSQDVKDVVSWLASRRDLGEFL